MLFRILRTPPGRWLVRLLFTKMTFVLPISRLCETDTLIAFWHPKPAYPFHIVLTPKLPVATLAELDPADSAFLTDLFSTVQQLVAEHHLRAYRLIVNGGEYQDFPHLHFHLVSETTLSR